MPTHQGQQTFANRQGETRDFWEGPPREAYDEACPIYTMQAKKAGARWEGGDGGPILKLPYRYGLGAGGSASVSGAWYNSTTPLAMRWQVTPGRHFLSIAESFNTRYLVKPSAQGQIDLWRQLMEVCPKRYAKVQSVMWWGNGGGAFAKGSGTGAATGTTFQLTNFLCAAFFEAGALPGQGDIIDFSATDGTTAGGTLRGVTRQVVGVDRDNGILTLDADLTGSGVLASDYVFLQGTFGQNANEAIPMTGVAAWNPLTHAKAITSLYGKDRSENPTKLAGLRLPLQSGKDPWVTALSVLTKCKEQSAHIDCLVMPPYLAQQLANSARPAALSVGGGQITNRSKSMRGGPGMVSNESISYSKPIADDPILMRYGVDGIEVQFFGRKVWVYESIYMSDITATREADLTMRGLRLEDFASFMGDMMPGFLDPSGQGAKTYVQGTDVSAALYGGIGNWACKTPANTIVASPNATIA